MRTKDLAAMLNQLAHAYAERGRREAVAAVEEIIAKVWDSRMRARLAALLEQGEHDLHDIALEAVRRILPDDESGEA